MKLDCHKKQQQQIYVICNKEEKRVLIYTLIHQLIKINMQLWQKKVKQFHKNMYGNKSH